MTTADRPAQDKKAGLPATRIGGRYVTSYDPEIALEIVEQIAQGHTIREICKPGTKFPHPVTFKRWVINNPDLARAYKAARLLSAEAFEEEALDLAREIRLKQQDGTQVRAYEVAMAQLRWSAERRDPEQYANRGQVNVRVPIQITTTLDMGSVVSSEVDGKSIYKISAKRLDSVENAVAEADKGQSDTPIVPETPLRKTKPNESAKT